MTEFVSAADAAESGSAFDQRAIRDEVADIIHRLRAAMDADSRPTTCESRRRKRLLQMQRKNFSAKSFEESTMSEGVNINALFTNVYESISTQGSKLMDSMDKLGNGAQLNDQDLLKMQFQVNQYNTMLEMASTVSKALVDEAKQIAQRAS